MRRVWTAVGFVGLAAGGVAACSGDPPPEKADTTVDPPDDTDSEVDSDVDSDPPAGDDSDPPVIEPPICDAEHPDGACPGAAACAAGRCLVDFDPGVPRPPGAVGDWDAIADFIGTRSLLLDTRPVDWATIAADGHAAVAAAPTRLQAAWAMVVATDRLVDGHTGLRPAAICDVDPGYGAAQSDVGACLVESPDGLVVAAIDPQSGFQRGDVLLSIDGRPAEALIADRLAQPRCEKGASTAAGVRHRTVLTLMYRPPGERSARVRRGGAEVDVPLTRLPGLECTGRVGAPGEAVLVDLASTATLDGGVALLVLGSMGARVGSDFLYEPLVDAMRAWAAGLAPGAPIVVDVRGNPGGHTEIAQVFGDWTLDDATAMWRCHQRLGQLPDDVGELITSRARPDPLILSGPLAVITDAGVYGSAEFLPRFVAETGRGVSVGEPTSGSFGISWPIPVGDWGAFVNALRCERPDGSALDGDPDPVDVPAVITAADAAAGVDTVIEAARRAVLR